MSNANVLIDPLVGEQHSDDLYRAAEVVRPVVGLPSIDDALIEQYQQIGFIAVERAFSRRRVDQAKAGLSDLIMGKAPNFKDIQFEAAVADRLDQMTLRQREVAVRKLMHFCNHDARLAGIARDPELLAVLCRLLGGREPACFQEMALLKPPFGREKPWHQDNAYFTLAPGEPVIGVWIALDEATCENGCMRMIPGSHREGPVIHFQRRDWQICDAAIEGRHIVAAPLKPGGLLLFNGLLHHGTPRNHTRQRRRALQFHYCAADAQRTDQAARMALFGSEGKNVTC